MRATQACGLAWVAHGQAARTMRDTGVALGRTAPHIPHAKIAAFEGIVAKTTDWRTLGVAPEELALREGSERVA